MKALRKIYKNYLGCIEKKCKKNKFALLSLHHWLRRKLRHITIIARTDSRHLQMLKDTCLVTVKEAYCTTFSMLPAFESFFLHWRKKGHGRVQAVSRGALWRVSEQYNLL